MNYRPIAECMIENTYELYQYWKDNNKLSYELNKYNYDIPVWRDMDDNTKCAAIEYVYKNRHTIELHSDIVQAWVQATAYFMLYDFVSLLTNGRPELEMFFDDLDFMIDEDILTNPEIQEQMGISADFTEDF